MGDLPSLFERNLQFVEQATVPALTSALLRAACQDCSRELMMLAEPEVPSQIYAIYETVPLEGKEKLKESLLAALAEWNPQWHGYPALRNLALTAGYIRATGVAGILRKIIAGTDVRPEKPNTRDALEIVFGVLGGFGQLPEVQIALERAQNEERYQKHFAAQIMNGLCYANPDHYPRYLEKFLTVAAIQKSYRVKDVVTDMVRLIGTEAVTQRLTDLNAAANEIVSQVLLRSDHKAMAMGSKIGFIDKEGRAFPIEGDDDMDAVWGLTSGLTKFVRDKYGSLQKYVERQAARVSAP